MDDRTSYDNLYKAAYEFVDRTNSLTSTQTITTIAEQSGYTLSADFMKLYLMNDRDELFIKYNDGTNDCFLNFKPKGEIIYENNTASQTIPDKFTIVDDESIDTQVTGTCTQDVNDLADESKAGLIDASGDFSDVSPGDIVHNVTDGSDGPVLSVTSSTRLDAALFNGTDNDFDLSDTYIIQPQARLKIVLDPPPSTSSHTITIYYVQVPDPVYSDYGIYRIPRQYLQALVFYAAWLYKYRDSEPNFGDAYFTFFNREVGHNARTLNKALNRTGFTVTQKTNRRTRR